MIQTKQQKIHICESNPDKRHSPPLGSTREEQIPICQDPWSDGRSYVGWHEYAEKLTKRGVEQHFCTVCQRYKFPGELCRLGKADRRRKCEKG